MANTPKKMKDPTEAALSAIQDALSVRDTAPEPVIPPAPPSTRPDEPAPEQPWRTVRAAAVKEEAFDDELHRAEDQGSLRRPANDDRESIGQILRSLQRRPARTSYVVATVFAVVWVLAGLMLGWMLMLLASRGHLAAALLLPLYYLADATITLGRRFARGERVWQAHRTHFYQRALDGGFTVTDVVVRVFVLNLALAILALVSAIEPDWRVDLAALALGGALVAWLLGTFARGKP